mgnify:CR=1 FL=1
MILKYECLEFMGHSGHLPNEDGCWYRVEDVEPCIELASWILGYGYTLLEALRRVKPEGQIEYHKSTLADELEDFIRVLEELCNTE